MAAEVRYEVREIFLSDDPRERGAALQKLAEEYRRLLLARWQGAGGQEEAADGKGGGAL